LLPFSFNQLSPPVLYTLSLHDALPIWARPRERASSRKHAASARGRFAFLRPGDEYRGRGPEQNQRRKPDWAEEHPRYQQAARERSEEHTSELQSRGHLVCRLLLEKKKK